MVGHGGVGGGLIIGMNALAPRGVACRQRVLVMPEDVEI